MEVKWSGDYITVISPTDSFEYEAVWSPDSVMALPVIDGEYVVRKEPLPSYMLATGKEKKFWTLVSGGVEDGETPLQALKRETKEETGIDLERIKVSKRKKQIPYVKHSAKKVSFYFFEVLEHERVEATGDGSEMEENAETHAVSLEELRDISNRDNSDFLLEFGRQCAENREADI